MRHLRIQDLPTARDQTVMRQLRIRELPTAADKLGTGFIVALIVVALFFGSTNSARTLMSATI